MDAELYKKQIESDIPLTASYVVEQITKTEWYLLDRADANAFTKKIFVFLQENIDSLTEIELTTIVEQCNFEETQDITLLTKLLDKSLEYRKPFIQPYSTYFDIFEQTKCIEYVKLLNEINYSDFDFLQYRFSKSSNYKEDLPNIYKKNFHSAGQESNKAIPKDAFNLFVMNKNLELFLSNELLTKEYKSNLLLQYKTTYFHDLFNTINANNKLTVDFDLIELTAKNIVTKKSLDNKNNIMSFISSLNTPEKIKQAVTVITSNPDIKQEFLSVFKEKINVYSSKEINFYTSPVKDFTNLNFFQYLAFRKNNPFPIQLCIEDKDCMKLFNNCLHERIKGFDYENSPLDLVLKNVILPSCIDDLYVYKIINKQIKPNMQDKVCAFLFKALIDYDHNHYNNNRKATGYETMLNAITLMPLSLIQKYSKRHDEILTTKTKEKITSIISMLSLSKLLVKKDSHQNQASFQKKTKI